MSAPLLTTKLYTPPPRPNLVPRSRLIEQMDEGLRRGTKLTLVSAPAGFGKTTLVTEWLYSRNRSISSRPVAWLSLDEGDNDPVRFFTYLIAALRQIDGSIGQATQSLLGAPQLPPGESLTALLINDITAASTPFVLVLDDYQLIHTSAIHDVMGFLLDHQPPSMHTVIAARRDPPLPLPRLRVRDQVTEIRADDLRFSAQEITTFLNQALGLALDAEIVAALDARTEGWIAGLQLAALSMKGKAAERVADFVTAFSGSHRHIIDYLADEVLAQQSDEVRGFLRQTGVLDRLTAPLCDAVTGRDDSDTVLKQLEQANLFLVPLDDRREWYRYHRLFADFLRTELEPEYTAGLHLKAAHWFEAQNLLPEAVKHTLATGDRDKAVRIITLAGSQALTSGSIVTLLDWLDALPDEVIRASGELASYKAWSLFMTGQGETAESYVRSAEASLPADASNLDRGRVLSLRCPLVPAQEVLQIAREALDLIGEADPLSLSYTLFMLGDAQDAVGDVGGAIETFRKAHHLGQQHGSHLIAAVALGHLGLSLNTQGKRREALALCQRGIRQYVDARDRPLPVAGLIYDVLGELFYEKNGLSQAHESLQTALRLGQQSVTMPIILFSLAELARTEFAMGQEERALATIREASRQASLEAHLLLRQGDVVAAERWAEQANLPLTGALDKTRRLEYEMHARLLVAQDHPEAAQRLLDNLERSAREDGRRRQLISIHILQALAAQMLGEKEKAPKVLEQTLRLAAPEDYLRAFLDEGPALVPLLRHVRHRAPAFVKNELLRRPSLILRR
jgi:LuxR family maltose regulon positive regulatory protein